MARYACILTSLFLPFWPTKSVLVFSFGLFRRFLCSVVKKKSNKTHDKSRIGERSTNYLTKSIPSLSLEPPKGVHHAPPVPVCAVCMAPRLPPYNEEMPTKIGEELKHKGKKEIDPDIRLVLLLEF